MAAKATARSRPTSKAAAAGPALPGAGFEPLHIKRRSDRDDRVPLFSADCEPCGGKSGDDDCACGGTGTRVYTIPAKPGANIALVYMEIIAEADGTQASMQMAEAKAYDYLFGEMLGPVGHKALKECTDLTLADLGQLIAILVKHTMGALEVPKEQPASA